MTLNDVMQDEAFVKELAELDTPEEVKDALNAKGVEVSLEEIRKIAKMAQSQAEGELDEDALEDVAGGSFDSFIKKVADTLEPVQRKMTTNRW